MRKVNSKEAEKVAGGRWKCTRCGKKFNIYLQAIGDHRFDCFGKIKWVLW